VDIIKGNTNRIENFKNCAVGCADGKAPISERIKIHVEKEKVNKECVNLPSIFVFNCLPLIKIDLHTKSTLRPR
jgi:hypothetical protein